MNILTVINIEHMFNECPWFVGGKLLSMGTKPHFETTVVHILVLCCILMNMF